MLNVNVGGTQYPVPSGAADTNWASRLVAVIQALATAVNAVTPYSEGTWTVLPLGAGWSTVGQVPQYRVDTFGTAEVRGSPGHTAGVGTVMGTLPPSARPKQALVVPCVAGFDLTTVGTVLIGTDGTITLVALGASTAGGVFIDSIRFSTL